MASSSDFLEEPLAQTWCSTQLREITKITFEWTIMDFSRNDMKCGQFLESSKFSAVPDVNPIWTMRLYPNGLTDEHSGYVSLFLCGNETLSGKFKMQILNGNESPWFKIDEIGGHNKRERGFKRFIKREDLFNESKAYISNDRLKLYCEINVENDPLTLSGRKVANSLPSEPYPSNVETAVGRSERAMRPQTARRSRGGSRGVPRNSHNAFASNENGDSAT